MFEQKYWCLKLDKVFLSHRDGGMPSFQGRSGSSLLSQRTQSPFVLLCHPYNGFHLQNATRSKMLVPGRKQGVEKGKGEKEHNRYTAASLLSSVLLLRSFTRRPTQLQLIPQWLPMAEMRLSFS